MKLGKMGSMAQFTDMQTLEDTGLNERMFSPLQPKVTGNLVNGAKPQILLNIPSEAVLMPIEGILSPIDIGHRNTMVNEEKYKLRSPTKATQEEIDLTKRYIGVNEQLKQTKVIKQSVIKGRRYTSQQQSGTLLP